MKLKSDYFSFLIPVIIILMMIIASHSCKKIENPNSDLDIKDTLKYDYIETRVFMEFVDAKTNGYLTTNQGDLIRVKISGSSREIVRDIIGVEHEYYYPQNGFVSFGMLPEGLPSESNPIRFSIRSELYGYLAQSKEVTICEPGDYYIRVSMINLSDPPEGVVVENMYNVGNLYNGVVFEDVIISTSNNEASVTIPSGTKLLDADTNILSGKLNLTLVYLNPETDMGLKTMQSGVNSTVLNNGVQNVLFSSGNLFEFVIMDSDWKRATFIEEKMLEYSALISSSVINPNSGTYYLPGDKVDFCAFDADTGMWVYQRQDTIKSGNYINGSTDLSGSFSFGNYKVNSCNISSGFKLTGSCEECSSVLLGGVVRKTSDNSFISEINIAGTHGKTNYFSGTTGSEPTYIVWDDNPDSNTCIVNPTFSPTNIDNMCSQTALNLPLLAMSPGLSVEATFHGRCPIDTNYVILPSFGIWVRNINSSVWNWHSMINGKAQLCNLLPGETYIVGMYFDNSWQYWDFVAMENRNYEFIINFSDDICRNVFGIL